MSIRLIAAAADRRLLDERRGTRAMMWIMAIMLFLTLLAAALGLGTLGAARLLERQVAGRLTVQIVEPVEQARADQTARALAALRAEPEVAHASAVDRAKLAELMRRWLMASATASVVILAARAGLDTHRDTIDVLHMLGSTDVQIARLFQRRIALDTLLGGIIGAVLATGVLLLVGAQIAALGSDLLSGLALGQRDWVLLALLPLGFALLAAFAARVAVLGALRTTL